MMSKKLVTGLFAAGLSIGMLAVSSTASAQYIGPTRVAPTTVNKVLKSPVDDQYCPALRKNHVPGQQGQIHVHRSSPAR